MEEKEYSSLNTKDDLIVDMIFEYIFKTNPIFTPDEASLEFRKIFKSGISKSSLDVRNIKNRLKMRNYVEQTLDDKLDCIKDDNNGNLLKWNIKVGRDNCLRFYCNREMEENLNDANLFCWYFDFTYKICPNGSDNKSVGILVGED